MWQCLGTASVIAIVQTAHVIAKSHVYCMWQRFYMERFNLKKLNNVEGKEQFRVQVSNRFADLDAEVEINSAWETIRDYKNVSQERV
jgi:hypothetical protein